MNGAKADARRNTQFDPEQQPLRYEPTLQIRKEETTGPITRLNPTHARFTLMDRATPVIEDDSDDGKGSEDGAPTGGSGQAVPSNVDFKYSERDNRKGRHALVVRPPNKDDEKPVTTPATTSSPGHVLKGIWRMFTHFPVWDVSWLVAFVFTLGSVVWVINGFFAFLPFSPGVEFPGQVLYGGGITAFIGATIFEVGSAFLMLEALNKNRSGCFGWAVERLYEGDENETGNGTAIVPAKGACSHHHQNTANLVGKPSLDNREASDFRDDAETWTWWPSTLQLKTDYFHDLGFIASLIQGIAATVFWISGYTALPGIYDRMSKPLVDALYWTPQVIGASGFVISGFLFMLETQRHWWTPAPAILGWHVGFWNFIGGVGFLLCPCFGYSTAHWAQYQACLSSFWGSCSFLLGSVLQWYESLEKHPVEVEKSHQA